MKKSKSSLINQNVIEIVVPIGMIIIPLFMFGVLVHMSLSGWSQKILDEDRTIEKAGITVGARAEFIIGSRMYGAVITNISKVPARRPKPDAEFSLSVKMRRKGE